MQDSIQRCEAVILEGHVYCMPDFIDRAGDGVERSPAGVHPGEGEPAIGQLIAVDVAPRVAAQCRRDTGVQLPGTAHAKVSDGLALMRGVAPRDPDDREVL